MKLKIIFFGLFVLLLLVSTGQVRAITFDNASNIGDFTAAGLRANPITFPHLTGASANVLYVGISNNRTTGVTPVVGGCPVALPATGSVTAISYGARTDFEPLTRSDNNALDTILSPNGCTSVEVFRLKNPPTGNNTLSITVTGGGDYVVIGAVTFIGADLSTSATGALVPASGDNTNQNPSVVVPTPFNGIVLDTIAAEFNATDITINPTTNPNQIRRWRLNGDPTPPPMFYVGAGSTKPATNISSVTMSWQLTNPGNWALGGVAIKEVISASPASIGGQVLTETNEPIEGAFIRLQNLQTGEVLNTTTDEKGNYYFEGLTVANLYQITADSKLYTFSPVERIFNLTESLEEVDFHGSRRPRNQRILK